MRAIDVPEKINTKDELYASLKAGVIENRLDTAKREIAKFIDKRPNDRIGLVGFAPLPYSICPPTLDHAWLIEHMKHLQPGIIGENTGIAGPISTAVQRLKDSEAKRRVIVLFTDGSNNVNALITPLQAAKLAANYDIVIYTVGIGSNRAFVIQNVFGSSQLVPMEGEFDEKLLQDMAKVSRGKYYKAADAEGMAKVMDEIDKMEKTSVEQPKIIEYSEFAPGMVTASLVMLLLAFTLENTFFRRLP
jgi:Ca-activated chloride channel family protein